jgi:hypothetical protein
MALDLSVRELLEIKSREGDMALNASERDPEHDRCRKRASAAHAVLTTRVKARAAAKG